MKKPLEIKDNIAREKIKIFSEALKRFKEALDVEPEENELALDATIQRFEFTFELSWKTLRKCLYADGIETYSPRETIKEAGAANLVIDVDLWLDMLENRNLTSHLYDKEKASEVYKKLDFYYKHLSKCLMILKKKFQIK